MTNNVTILLCLFHDRTHARDAMQELVSAGTSQTALSMLDDSQPNSEQTNAATLAQLGVPERDHSHLLQGIRGGGLVLVVEATADQVSHVERAFSKHRASKIDEAAGVNTSAEPALMNAAEKPVPDGEVAIPLVQEELVVGKREVERGGVRVYRRVVEVPVEEAITLREEHVVVEHRAVDRPATEMDLAFGQDQTIELTETAEEVVLAKSAQVVEEVRIGKQFSEHTEHIHDTVRKTVVEVQEIAPEADDSRTSGAL